MIYLNVEIDADEAARGGRRSSAGEPVWFGCDTGKMSHADLGLWDEALYDYGALYDTEFDARQGGPAATTTRR